MVFQTAAILGVSLLFPLAQADVWDISAKLTKPPLAQNLDYLTQNMYAHFPSTPSNRDKWSDGWIPKDCYDLATGNGNSPADIETYNVNYQDCNTAWVLCWHKQSILSLDDLIDNFGRVPVGARQFVRHVISLPDDKPGAQNNKGNIMLNAIGGTPIDVFIHETGHSLDFQGAYKGGQLSNSQDWIDAYNQDSKVPDGYAATNAVEDVAQNTVLAAYNIQVPGGFGMKDPGWQSVFHQYDTVQRWQGESGNLLVPGRGGCARRLKASDKVRVDNGQPGNPQGGWKRGIIRGMGINRRDYVPDHSLGEGVEEIPRVEFNTEKCNIGHS
ncbi:MAG: hypothetical protein Q9220_001517 [cf. Caloplaca sp. 1 TL-2023]